MKPKNTNDPTVLALDRFFKNITKAYAVSVQPATDGEDVLFATALCFKGKDSKKIATEVRNDLATLCTQGVSLGDCQRINPAKGGKK